MAPLKEVYEILDSALRNRIAVAGWNKGKALLTTGTPSAEDKAAAKILLSSAMPPEIVARGVVVVIQDEDEFTDAVITTAVGQVVDTLIDVGI